ncbi:MAG TPA: aminotransferase class V-fold PLP-dependent enzyme [Gemmatimonadales bacterium]|jgi:selenocysteine lyase/cysteine desulfurase
MQKREFVQTVGAASLAAVFGEAHWPRYAHATPAELAPDDAFWAAIRRRFLLTPDYINLENGYYLMQPESVLAAFIGHVRDVNRQASRYMRTRQAPDKLAARRAVAVLAGCSPDELIITRNTTESLDTVIAGIDWKPGDEAVMAEQDYGAMLDMFRLQARRRGMVNRVVSLPLHPQSDDEIVQLYANAITPRTRLLMVCHMVNITGQILPVARICAMAHAHDIPVMVDGAHAFAQIQFAIPDLKCDYYGSSLHKWLGTPLGAGLLYVRRDRIPALWPIFSDMSVADDDIAKLNHTGTHPVHTDLTITDAIGFHQMIGAERKEARLRYIQRYWTDKVRGKPKIIVNTPEDPARSCAIANVGVEGIKPADLAATLFDKYRIWTVAIDGAGVHGVRITPHLFTDTTELDHLVKALTDIAAA